MVAICNYHISSELPSYVMFSVLSSLGILSPAPSFGILIRAWHAISTETIGKFLGQGINMHSLYKFAYGTE